MSSGREFSSQCIALGILVDHCPLSTSNGIGEGNRKFWLRIVGVNVYCT